MASDAALVPVCKYHTKVGCYDVRKTDNPTKNMKFLMNTKKNGTSKMKLSDFVCICAEITRQIGATHFAIQDGDCYYGVPTTGAAQVAKCVETMDAKKTCNAQSAGDCVGPKNYTFIYQNDLTGRLIHIA